MFSVFQILRAMGLAARVAICGYFGMVGVWEFFGWLGKGFVIRGLGDFLDL
jgi:hypothetical protein